MTQKHVEEQQKSHKKENSHGNGDFLRHTCLNLPGASRSMSEQCEELNGEKSVFLKKANGTSHPLIGGNKEIGIIVIQKRHQKSQIQKHCQHGCGSQGRKSITLQDASDQNQANQEN